jgi:hypothetical protein
VFLSEGYKDKIKSLAGILSENMQQVKDYLNKREISIDHQDVITLKEKLKNNLGYLLKFIKFRFEEGVDLDLLLKEIDKILSKASISSRIGNINSFKTFNELQTKISELSEDKILNDFIIEFPSEKRNIFENITEEKKEYLIKLLKAFNRVDKEAKKSVFGMSAGYLSIEDVIEKVENIIQATKEGFGFNNIIEYISKIKSNLNGDGIEVLLADSNKGVIIAKVTNYEASKKLGCTTKWCITYKDSHFSNYQRGGYSQQYFIWLTPEGVGNKYFLLGATQDVDGSFSDIQDADNISVSISAFEKLLSQYGINKSLLKPVAISDDKIEDELEYFKIMGMFKIPAAVIKKMPELKRRIYNLALNGEAIINSEITGLFSTKEMYYLIEHLIKEEKTSKIPETLFQNHQTIKNEYNSLVAEFNNLKANNVNLEELANWIKKENENIQKVDTIVLFLSYIIKNDRSVSKILLNSDYLNKDLRKIYFENYGSEDFEKFDIELYNLLSSDDDIKSFVENFVKKGIAIKHKGVLSNHPEFFEDYVNHFLNNTLFDYYGSKKTESELSDIEINELPDKYYETLVTEAIKRGKTDISIKELSWEKAKFFIDAVFNQHITFIPTIEIRSLDNDKFEYVIRKIIETKKIPTSRIALLYPKIKNENLKNEFKEIIFKENLFLDANDFANAEEKIKEMLGLLYYKKSFYQSQSNKLDYLEEYIKNKIDTPAYKSIKEDSQELIKQKEQEYYYIFKNNPNTIIDNENEISFEKFISEKTTDEQFEYLSNYKETHPASFNKKIKKNLIKFFNIEAILKFFKEKNIKDAENYLNFDKTKEMLDRGDMSIKISSDDFQKLDDITKKEYIKFRIEKDLNLDSIIEYLTEDELKDYLNKIINNNIVDSYLISSSNLNKIPEHILIDFIERYIEVNKNRFIVMNLSGANPKVIDIAVKLIVINKAKNTVAYGNEFYNQFIERSLKENLPISFYNITNYTTLKDNLKKEFVKNVAKNDKLGEIGDYYFNQLTDEDKYLYSKTLVEELGEEKSLELLKQQKIALLHARNEGILPNELNEIRKLIIKILRANI